MASLFDTQTSKMLKDSIMGNYYLRAKTSESVVLSGATAVLDMGLSVFNWGVTHTVPKSLVLSADRKISAIATGSVARVAQAGEKMTQLSQLTGRAGAQLSQLTGKLVSTDPFDLVDDLLDSTVAEPREAMELGVASVSVPEQPEHVPPAKPAASLRAAVLHPTVIAVRSVATAGKALHLTARLAQRSAAFALDLFSLVTVTSVVARLATWLLTLHERIAHVPAVQMASSHLPSSISSVAAQADQRVVALLTSQADRALPKELPPSEEPRDGFQKAEERDSFLFVPTQEEGLDSE